MLNDYNTSAKNGGLGHSGAGGDKKLPGAQRPVTPWALDSMRHPVSNTNMRNNQGRHLILSSGFHNASTGIPVHTHHMHTPYEYVCIPHTQILIQ